MNKIKTVDYSQLVKAHWNYKEPGTPEQIHKLAMSILEDNSAGVLPVRKIETPEGTPQKYEVMDGNHRYESIGILIKEHGWNKVVVEEFENVSDAKAAIIATRRNGDWFDDDLSKLSALMVDVVLPEFPSEDLLEIMPYSSHEFEYILGIYSEEDSAYVQEKNEEMSEKLEGKNKEISTSDFDDEKMLLTFSFSKDNYFLVQEAISEHQEKNGIESAEESLLSIIKEHKNV